MTKIDTLHILALSDGAPFTTVNLNGSSAVLLVCEHASKYIPKSLNNLDLDDHTANSHVAWDPGALAVSEMLSSSLDAGLIYANISRLVYDCNRPPDATGAMPVQSEIYPIKGNIGLSDKAKAARIAEVYVPFTKAIASQIATRSVAGMPTVIVTIHSFTPVYFGETRGVELGILHDKDAELADAMLALPCDFDVRRNQPYGPEDGVTHTLKIHALEHGLLNVMIEIRNDLVATKAGQITVTNCLSNMITGALDSLEISTRTDKDMSNV